MADRLPIWLLLLSVVTLPSQSAVPPRDAAAGSKAGSGNGAISGRITDKESGRPLPRALVTLSLPSTAAREVLADAEGRYEFTGLPPGQYGVSAGPGDLRMTHLHQAFGQVTPTQQRWNRPPKGVELNAGELRSGVDLALPRTLAIEGRVIDPWEEPMAEVQVIAIDADGRPSLSPPAPSDDRGNYRLFGLPPGRYRVCADRRHKQGRAAEGPAHQKPGRAGRIVACGAAAG
jgi:Carboxypeptidase regulatory-like domain